MSTTIRRTTTNGQAKSEEKQRILRCWLCNSDKHQAGRCEKKCRGEKCAKLGLRVHSWSECPNKTKPFCQLCGETGHGVFASRCIHRCYAHQESVHLISECSICCYDCGARGHLERSRVCPMRRDKRPMSLLDVASFKRVIPVEQSQEPQQPVEQPKPAPTKKQAQQPPKPSRQVQTQPKKQERSAPVAATTQLQDKETQMKRALEELEREKTRILKELEQLQKDGVATEKPQAKVAEPRTLTKVQGRKTLKQSRG